MLVRASRNVQCVRLVCSIQVQTAWLPPMFSMEHRIVDEPSSLSRYLSTLYARLTDGTIKLNLRICSRIMPPGVSVLLHQRKGRYCGK